MKVNGEMGVAFIQQQQPMLQQECLDGSMRYITVSLQIRWTKIGCAVQKKKFNRGLPLFGLFDPEDAFLTQSAHT